MENTILKLLQPDNIITLLSAPDAKTTIQQLSTNLVNTGFVVEEFADDVWRREQLFPTGLPTHPHGIAIPHADHDHVLQSAIAIGILSKPVLFDRMASDHAEKIYTWIVFLLAINEKEQQISLLQEIIDLVRIPGLIEKLLSANTSQEVIKILEETIHQ